MPRLDELANVALRVPSILVLDLLYKCDIEGLTENLKAKNEDMLFKYKYVIWNMFYIAHLINLVVLILPLRHIVTLYLHVLVALLLYMAHLISRDYIHEEMKLGYEEAVYHNFVSINRFVSTLTSQIMLSTLCALLMHTRKVWLFSFYLLPLLARLCGVPLSVLLTVNAVSMGLTVAGVVLFLLANLFVPYRLAKAAFSELLSTEVVELYRLLNLGISLWNQLAVPALFSVFWFVLFAVQLASDISASPSASFQEFTFFLLTGMSECCATPYSLLGLTFVVSYLALGLLNLCKFYLGGYAAVQNENVMHRGVTEGVTMLLLALQTGLLDMQAQQRTFLLSIILFIVLTSTLQSMIEITDPIVLSLGASRNGSVWKHFRGLSMCLLLLVFPVFMAYKISQFFHMDFWLLILVSSCMLTSLQVTGTMLIYCLFMVELFRSDPIESLDEVIYWVNAISRVLEFLVALCVVVYGTWESLFGEWSWMGASVIIIHSYFNVWLRAQSGWKSFLLRREAAKKINSLPRATEEQLEKHNDVCAICFQEMNSAVITYCGHFFHGNCLRKWLYVQETCPMCHQTVRRTAPGQGPAEPGHGPADPPQVDARPDPEAQEGEQRDVESGTANGTPSDDGDPDLGGGWSESEDPPSDPDSEADGDRSSGSDLDVLPVSSGGSASSQNQPGRTSPSRHSQPEANGTDSSSWTNVGTVTENQSASEPTGRQSFTLHPNQDVKSKQSQRGVSLSPPEGKNGVGPVGAQTSLESCNQICDSVNNRLGLCTYSQLERLSQGEPVSQILQPSSSGTTESTVTDCSPSVP